MASKKKKRKTTAAPRPRARGLRDKLAEAWRTQPESILLALAMVHIFAMLLMVVVLGTLHEQSVDRPFGVSERATGQAEPVPRPPPIGPVRAAVVAYVLFTVAVWALLVNRRRRLKKQAVRLLLMMQIPGTAMAVYAVVRTFVLWGG